MIQDFGVKIEGAAKDRWRSFLERMGAVRDADILKEPFSRSFPEPNYGALIKDEVDPWTVSFVRALRDNIPTKPKRIGTLTWVKNVILARNLCRDLLNGDIPKEALLEALKHPNYDRLNRRLDDRIALYETLGHSKSLRDYKVAQVAYSKLDGVTYDPALIRFEVYHEKSKHNITRVSHGQTREEAILVFRDSLRDAPEARPVREVEFSLYRKGGGSKSIVIGKKIGSTVIELQICPDVSSARAYLNDHHQELVDKLERIKTPPSERGQDNLPRSGAAARGDRDISPAEFIETFGFRGVQFGNYVEQSRRQRDLNDSYDAFMDLASVLNAEPSALSLNGRLGLAFGARGRGGIGAAAAHYEPVQVVINLTKTRGAGSLAHEWFHGLDNAIGRLEGSMTSYGCEAKSSNVTYLNRLQRGQIEAMRDLSEAIGQTQVPERSSALDLMRSTHYWSTSREMTARCFEAWVIQSLSDRCISNDYLANIVDEDVYEAEAALMGAPPGRYPYPKSSEMPLISEAFSNAFGVRSLGIRDILGKPVVSPEFRLAEDQEPRIMISPPTSTLPRWAEEADRAPDEDGDIDFS